MRTKVAVVVAMLAVLGAGPVRAEDRVANGLNPVGATYINGTVTTLSENTSGTFDTGSSLALELHFGKEQISIPYVRVRRCSYREENKFRLGVLATIVVGLLKARTKNHFVTLTWNDGEAMQVLTLETPKQSAIGLVEVIRARAPEACKPKAGGGCFVTP